MLRLGFCADCDTVIFDKSTGRRLKNYREVWLLLSDKSKMRVAVCNDCQKKLDKKIADNIITRHQEFWLAEIGKGKKEQKDKITKLEVKEFSTKETTLNFHHSIAKSYSFSPTTVIRSSEVNQNFDDCITSLKADHHKDADGTVVVPNGLIAMWHGTIAAIPTGWKICDGNEGTPNLVAKFVRGVATAATNPGATGGADTHTLSAAEIPAHDHGSAGAHTHSGQYDGNVGNGPNVASGADIAENTAAVPSGGAHTHTSVGSSGAHNNMPAYYEVAFIMRKY